VHGGGEISGPWEGPARQKEAGEKKGGYTSRGLSLSANNERTTGECSYQKICRKIRRPRKKILERGGKTREKFDFLKDRTSISDERHIALALSEVSSEKGRGKKRPKGGGEH